MSALVSIIMPVYNVAPFLASCLDSVVNQSYTQLEIIIVNDGSTDESGDICKEYAKKDPRIIYIDKENGGVSSARNVGIKSATGDFLTFVDSDDLLELDYVESMLDLALTQAVDVVSCNILQWDPEKAITMAFPGTSNSLKTVAMDADTAIENMLRNRLITAGPYAKLIKRDIIDGEQFMKLVIAEDLEFNVRIFSKAKKILYRDSDVYKYRQSDSGAMRKPFSPSHMDAITATSLILDNAIGQNTGYIKAAKYRLIRAAMYCAGGMIHSGQKTTYKKYYDECGKLIKKHAMAAALDRRAAPRMRIFAVLAAVSIPLSWKVMLNWHRLNTVLKGKKQERHEA